MTLRVFKDLGFDDGDMTAVMLMAAALEIDSGLIDARLGGFLLKKRVAMPGRGKSRSWRVIVAWKQGERLFYLHAFTKKTQKTPAPKSRWP